MTRERRDAPSRSSPYRVVHFDPDPDLSRPPSGKFSETQQAFERAWQQVIATDHPTLPLLTIQCLPHDCGNGRREGCTLARVFKTDEGFLYVAEVVLPRHDVQTFQETPIRMPW